MENFGYLLKECRYMASPNKLSQKAVADVLMKDVSYVSRVEVGKIHLRFSHLDLLKLASLFRENNVPEAKIQELMNAAESSVSAYMPLEDKMNELHTIFQPKHSNDFRYLLQKAIDLYAQTQKRNFSDVLAEMDDQLGYGRNSHTIQSWLNQSIIPNSAEVEYFAKKITAGTNLDSKWIRNLFDAAGYQVPSYIIPRSLRVFLCHAHSDAVAVRDIYNRLIKSDVDAWLDKEKLLPGSNWEYEIRKAVREADVVVICLSKNFNQRGFRQKEVRIALDVAMEQPEGEIFIIPVRLEECKNLESLSKWHWVDLFEEDGYEILMRAFQARANNIGAVLQRKGSADSKITLPTKPERLPARKSLIKSNTEPSAIEHLSGILSRYESGDLDGYSYGEITGTIESLESFGETYSDNDDLLTLCTLASSIVSHLFVARGYATPDIPRAFEYYQIMNEVRKLMQSYGQDRKHKSGTPVQSAAEHLSEILNRYENGDLDRYSYGEITGTIEYLESFQNLYGADDDSFTLCKQASDIVSHLYVARGYATHDLHRSIKYYKNMNYVRRITHQIIQIK